VLRSIVSVTLIPYKECLFQFDKAFTRPVLSTVGFPSSYTEKKIGSLYNRSACRVKSGCLSCCSWSCSPARLNHAASPRIHLQTLTLLLGRNFSLQSFASILVCSWWSLGLSQATCTFRKPLILWPPGFLGHSPNFTVTTFIEGCFSSNRGRPNILMALPSSMLPGGTGIFEPCRRCSSFSSAVSYSTQPFPAPRLTRYGARREWRHSHHNNCHFQIKFVLLQYFECVKGNSERHFSQQWRNQCLSRREGASLTKGPLTVIQV